MISFLLIEQTVYIYLYNRVNSSGSSRRIVRIVIILLSATVALGAVGGGVGAAVALTGKNYVMYTKRSFWLSIEIVRGLNMIIIDAFLIIFKKDS
jgi:hypothetical protein